MRLLLHTVLLPTALVVLLLVAPPAWAEDPDPADPPGWSEAEGVPSDPPPAGAGEGPAGTKDDPIDPTAPEGEEGEPELPLEPEPFVMPTENTVVDIKKNHNQDWIGNWKALELELALAIVGEKDKRVGATVVFYEVATGLPLRATMEPYVDGNGHVSVYSKAVPIPVDSGLYTSRLKIPYRAFPWPTKGPAYAIEARVTLLRLEDDGTVTTLADGVTQFTVHYEKGCGAAGACPCPFGRTAGWIRLTRYDWYKMWGDCLGTEPTKSGLPPPKGVGDKTDWFEAKWRTRGGCIDDQGRGR